MILKKGLLSLLVIAIVLACQFSSCYADCRFSNDSLIDVIYHGSTNKDIVVIKPQTINVRDKSEGAVIFATPSIKLASCYLIKWDDSWVHQSISQSVDKAKYEVHMVIADRERFNKLDRGGAIYLLPHHNFTFDKTKGLGIYEWTSKTEVRPYTRIIFNSSLDAMKTFGVKVYFVNKKQFQAYLKLSGEGRENFLKKFEEF